MSSAWLRANFQLHTPQAALVLASLMQVLALESDDGNPAPVGRERAKGAVMQSITTILVHSSRFLSEGLRRLLQGTPFRMFWLSSLQSPVPTKLLKAKREVLFIVGAMAPPENTKIIRQIVGQYPGARIVMIGCSPQPDAIVEALHAGASGYLQESMSSAVLVKALELIIEGETVAPTCFIRHIPQISVPALSTLAHSHVANDTQSAIDAIVLQPCRTAADPAPVDSRERAGPTKSAEDQPIALGLFRSGKTRALSSKEADILGCLVHGLSNKDISRKLSMAEATVKVHLKAILRKIQKKNRTQAAIWAVEHLKNDGSCDLYEQRPSPEGNCSPPPPRDQA